MCDVWEIPLSVHNWVWYPTGHLLTWQEAPDKDESRSVCLVSLDARVSQCEQPKPLLLEGYRHIVSRGTYCKLFLFQKEKYMVLIMQCRYYWSVSQWLTFHFWVGLHRLAAFWNSSSVSVSTLSHSVLSLNLVHDTMGFLLSALFQNVKSAFFLPFFFFWWNKARGTSSSFTGLILRSDLGREKYLSFLPMFYRCIHRHF